MPTVLPRYFCPDGIAMPAHLMLACVAPIGCSGGVCGLPGQAYGGPYHPDLEWVAVGDYWMHWPDAARPQDLLRVKAPAALAVASEIEGRVWHVPHLWDSVLGDDGQPYLAPAVPLYFGPDGYRPDPDLELLMEDLRDIYLRLSDTDDADPQLAAMACRLIACCHHLVAEELIALRLLTQTDVINCLSAAWGCGHEADDADL